MSKRLVTVFGATGTQGGAVVSMLLSNSTLSQQFSVRGITRNTSSEKAKSLGAKGVELVAADLNKPESLVEAVKGSHAVFVVTNYWESGDREVEVTQGKNIADACVKAGVKHAVWSALPNVTKMTNGALKHVEHFDSKAEVAEYFDQVKKSASMITTHFMPGFYMSNIHSFTQSNPQVNDGVPSLTMPWDPETTQVPLFDAAKDTGTFVGAILGHSNPQELDGKWIQAVSEWMTPSKIVATVSEVTGKEVKFNPVPQETFQYIMSSMPKGDELTENMALVRDYSYYGKGAEQNQAESDAVLKDLGLETETFEAWAKKVGPWNF